VRSIGALPQTASPEQRRETLKELFFEARTCERCPQLAQTRTQVVFGAGNADAEIMFVGEAPGEREDAQGVPFVGAAGKLLETLLGGIGLGRDDVFIANVLKCRPPQNRDPHPQEIERCEPWLWRQIELIEPTVVVTLGRYASGLLRGEMAPLGAIRGRAEVRILGSRAVRLLPVLHPAAALYRREPNLRLLEEDFALIPGLLEQGPPEQPPPLEPVPEFDDPEAETPPAEAAPGEPGDTLDGLPGEQTDAADEQAGTGDEQADMAGEQAGEPNGSAPGEAEPQPEEQQLGLF
jgi:DNA polymerase